MEIGLFHNKKISQVKIVPVKGDYELYGDTTFLSTIIQGEEITIRNSGNSVSAELKDSAYRGFGELKLIPKINNSSLRYTIAGAKSRLYKDGALFKASKSLLKIINSVTMNNYLSGVIESEGGGGKHIEYYKVQALMSRTYALKNLKRHSKSGFQLCDGVHCQAYHSELRYTPTINEAVLETEGKILVDSSNKLVTTYFAANCGGETCDASFVWNTSVWYVQPFIDTFCMSTRQAKWTKKIKKTVWKSFIEKKYGVFEKDLGEWFYNFEQEQRKAFYIHPSIGIPLRDLRKEFRLKSTFFSSSLEGDYVILRGKGFGHGVGLCQEGAMGMANSGYNYDQIARFYFNGVRVLDYYKDVFFQQESE